MSDSDEESQKSAPRSSGTIAVEEPQKRVWRRRPPQPKQQTFDPADSTKLPSHLRLRYWTSWEEMRLVELWRRHSAEVTTLLKNTPIFRTISDGMRQWGFHVNSQECRRKISSLKNKYVLERRRIEHENLESDWKLYPLIHCLLAPRIKNPDLNHEIQIVNLMIAKLPPPLPEELKPPAAPTQVAACQRPTSGTLSVRTAHNSRPYQSRHHQQQHSRQQQHRTLPYQPQSTQQTPPTVAPSTAAAALAFLDLPNTDSGVAGAPAKRKYVWRNLPTDAGSYVLKHHFTQTSLEQLRAENQRLEESRDDALKHLNIEEREYEYLVSYFAKWTAQQEQLLQRLNSNAK